MTMPKSPGPTVVGAGRSAVAVHTGWSRVPEFWALGVITLCVF
jgi:hypothetical protein